MKIDSAGTSTQYSTQLSSLKLKQPDGGQLAAEPQLRSTVPADQVRLGDATATEADTQRLFRVSDNAVASAMNQMFLGESDILNRINSVLARLGKEQQQQLIDLDLFSRESFLNVAEQLNDEELGKLLNVVDGLQTKPKTHVPVIDPDGISNARTTKAFIDKLATLDANDLKQVLDRAAPMADKVAPPAEPHSYKVNGHLIRDEGSQSANDLHNLVSAVTKSDDVGQMFERLDNFDDTQQAQLLLALGTNADLGNRLMENLDGRDKAAQDSALNYLSGLIHESALMYRKDSAVVGHNYGVGESTGAGDADFDNHLAGSELIENTLALMESYQFSDKQLEQMTDQLSGLNRTDQRAYLMITQTGLDHLLGGSAENPVSLDENRAALATIDSLRNNDSVRNAVMMARTGPESGLGEDLYQIKQYGLGVSDQQEMVKLLATDAWLSPGDTERSATLADKLSQIDSDQRDRFVRNTNALVNSDTPLAQRSEEALQQQYKSVLNRTNTLINTEDIAGLFAAEESISEVQKDNFWKVTELAEENVDQFVDMLMENTKGIREQIVASLAQEVDRVDNGEKRREDAQEDLNDLIRYFSKDRTDSQKLNYLS